MKKNIYIYINVSNNYLSFKFFKYLSFLSHIYKVIFLFEDIVYFIL